MSLRRPTVACLSFTFQYKPFMWCRLDARLWHDYLYLPFEASLETPDRFSVICFTYHVMQIFIIWMSIIILLMTHSCMHLLYLLSELSCEYFQSTHLACWFGQMLTKAISWMRNSIASPTPRGVPVSPVRSCFGHCIISASATAE